MLVCTYASSEMSNVDSSVSTEFEGCSGSYIVDLSVLRIVEDDVIPNVDLEARVEMLEVGVERGAQTAHQLQAEAHSHVASAQNVQRVNQMRASEYRTCNIIRCECVCSRTSLHTYICTTSVLKKCIVKMYTVYIL